MKLGLSFRAVSWSLRDLRSSEALYFLGNVSEEISLMYLKAPTSMSLQQIDKHMKSLACWPWLIVFDIVKIVSSLYIDLHVRLHNIVEICIFHVLGIPIFGSHSGEAIRYLIYILFESVVGSAWKCKFIGISSYGAAITVGKISDAVIRLDRDCLRGL